MTIKILNTRTAEQIAAGEVIENPASVVKELVENALDAGAGRIEVKLEGGGAGSIIVSDNGCGISHNNLPLAFARFATSKLETIDDLESLITLGFRGEALPSIAAVARVTMTTCVPGELSGSRIELAGGEILEHVETGAPPGTAVEVRDLFYNTPGRRKFLRAPAVEQGRVTALITNFALAHPEVSFILKTGNKTLLQTTGDGSLLHVIGTVYGHETAKAMLELKRRDPDTGSQLAGFISFPYLNRASRRHITIVINGRLVKTFDLIGALERGYRNLLPRGRYPVAVLHLAVPPAILDVNVHPAKTEVRFQRGEALKDLVYYSVSTALNNHGSRPRPLKSAAESGLTQSFNQQEMPQPPYYYEELNTGTTNGAISAGQVPFQPEPQAKYRLIGQLLNSYLVVQREDDLLIIDQHAAHERVLYNELSSSKPISKRAAQLTVPLQLEVPPDWFAELSVLLPLLEELGVKMEPFGDNSYIVRSLPFSSREGHSSGSLYAMLEELVNLKTDLEGERREKVIKTVACHRAVKAHQALSFMEMEKLLEMWIRTTDAEYCPHGRPAVVVFSQSELEKHFRRKGV